MKTRKWLPFIAASGLAAMLTPAIGPTVVAAPSDTRRAIAAPAAQATGTKPRTAARLVVQLVDEQGEPLTNQSISMMPATVGYPQADANGPYHADKDGKVTIDSVSPGERVYVLRQGWPVPTIVTLQVPPSGLQTKVAVKKGGLPGGIPDLDIKTKVHEENGRRTVDVALWNNTDRSYPLITTDLQLVSGDYRIIPPPSALPLGAEVTAKGKGSYRLALDWDEYLHRGIWVSRRGEDVTEEIPAAPAGAGMACYRVVVGNNGSLPFELPKLDQSKGRVIDHAGNGVPGVTVYLVSNECLRICNGKAGQHWNNGKLERFGDFNGSEAATDKEGRFTLTVVGGDRLVVVAGDMVWLARLELGKDQTVQLPQPGKVTISYDIEGAAKEGVFRLELMAWDMPDWRGVVQTERYVVCKNGGTLEVGNLEPGEYDVFRLIERLPVGGVWHSAFCDRSTLKIEGGKAAKLEYVRTKGGPISGQVVGLKEAKLDGALVYVRAEQATGDIRAANEWKLTIFDALVTGPDGQFKTSRIAPGAYMVTVEACAPVDRTEGRFSGIRLPLVIGKTKVVVPESGQVPPVRIELAPLPWVAPAATAPAARVTSPQATQPATSTSIIAKLDIAKQKGQVNLSLEMTDVAGNKVTSIMLGGKGMPPPPRFQVLDADGMEVYQGVLAYG